MRHGRPSPGFLLDRDRPVLEGHRAIDRALTRLESLDERLARVVEWRFFGGMTEEETAEALGVTVRRDWLKARAFLYRELQGGGPE